MTGVESTDKRTAGRVRPLPVTALGVVLLTQGVLSTLIGAAKLGAPGLEFLGPIVGVLNVFVGAGLILLSPLYLTASIGFFRLWPRAWLIGMGLQGLGLLVSLTLYFYSNVKPDYIYAAMAYHILTILYLNSRTVQRVFRVEGEDGF